MTKPKVQFTSGIAYSYIRFSRPEQLKGDSLRRQTQDSAEYAAAHGLRIDPSINLRDLGMSAYLGKNAIEGALAGFLEAIRTGKVEAGATLLVESLDRLSRDQITDALTQFLGIINAGLTVVTLMDKMVYSRQSINDNPGSLMMSIVVMMRAYEESATKGKRVGAAWAKKRKLAVETGKPLTSLCPEWLELKDGAYVVRKNRVKIVKWIFEQAAAGKGKRWIAKELNASGEPTWSVWATEPRDPETGEFIIPATPEESRIGKIRGNGWHDSYVQKILTSPAVRGIFQPHKRNPETRKREPHGDPIEGYFPVVISATEWENAHKRSRAPTGPRRTKVSNLFSGIIFDGYNGAVMRYLDKGNSRAEERGRSGTSDWRYLKSDINRLQKTAEGQFWYYGPFERWLLNHLRNLNWESLLNSQPDVRVAILRNSEAELTLKSADLRKAMDKIITNFISSDTSSALQKTIKEKASAIAEELEGTETQLQIVRDEIDQISSEKSAVTEGLDEFRALIAEGDIKSRLRLQMEIRRRIKSIHLFRHGHPTMPAPWPTVVIVYANGSPQVSMINNMFRKEPGTHHANRQVRDPITGAFRKLKRGETQKLSVPPANHPVEKPAPVKKKTFPAPSRKIWTEEERQKYVAELLPPWDLEEWPK